MAALTLTDLDDFLTPSQACIIPVRQSNKPAGQDTGDNANTDIVIDDNNNYYEVSTFSTSVSGNAGVDAGRQALKKAEISLNDCLACSGCITSTESLLITMQSHNEVLDFIKAGEFKRSPVLSLAPQTLASLAASYARDQPIPLLTLLRRIRAFLAVPERGGWQVLDTTFARHVALRETVREFAERREASTSGKGKSLPMLASACPGWVCYAEKAQGDLLPLLSATRSPQGVMGALVKQYLASKEGRTPADMCHVTAMPCYDKKLEASRQDFYNDVYQTRETDCVLTTGELDLLLHELGFDPYAPVEGESSPSTASDAVPFPELLQHPGSSSGSYLGALLTSLAASYPNATVHRRAIRSSPDNVEYTLELGSEVLFKGATVYGFRNLQNLVRKVGKETGIGRAGPRGAGAGRLQAAVAARRRKARTGQGEIQTPATPGSPRTPDTVNGVSHADADVAGAALISARESKKLDFVEVMACPGGCVNGGGQMKPASGAKAVDAEGYSRPLPEDGEPAPPTSSGLAAEEGMRWSTKEWVAKVEAVYWSGLPTPPPSPTLAPTATGDEKVATIPARTCAADELADKVVSDMMVNEDRFSAVRTRFRKVEGDVLSQGGLTHEQVKW